MRTVTALFIFAGKRKGGDYTCSNGEVFRLGGGRKAANNITEVQIMQDEVNEKIVALSFRAARLTKETLARTLRMYLHHRQGKKMRGVVQKHGKLTVKELVGQGQGASSMDIGEDNIKDFERIARKYDVDFAVKKDKSMVPPKYIVFFKGKDQDVISQAFKEFVDRNEKKKERPSLKAKLKEYIKKAVSPDKNRERTKEKHKDRGQSL